MRIYCPVAAWSGDTLVSSSLVDAADPGERPLLSSVPFFWRLKRLVVSADHCETPALPLALTRANNLHAIYPSTILVEIQADKAVRRTMSMLRNVPKRATSTHASGSTRGGWRTIQSDDEHGRKQGGTQARERGRCDDKYDEAAVKAFRL